jgi:hypothetical protein
MSGGEKGFYLYCLAESGSGPVPRETGTAFGTPLLFHAIRGITAVFESVPLDVFCGPDWEPNVHDPSWLIPRTVRHEKIIEQVRARSSVIPVRFGTIFSSLDSLNSFLVQNEQVIKEFFVEIEGKSEWGVKGFVNRERARERAERILIEEEAEFLSTLPTGRRYFEERKILSRADEVVRERLNTVFEAVWEDLSRHAFRIHDLSIIEGMNFQDDLEAVFNRAFLVPESSLASFKDCLERSAGFYKADGIVFSMSGPWPPYSFSPPLIRE